MTGDPPGDPGSRGPEIGDQDPGVADSGTGPDGSLARSGDPGTGTGDRAGSSGPNRRRFLRACGVLGTVAAAGCLAPESEPESTPTTESTTEATTRETTTDDGSDSTPDRIDVAADLEWTMAGNGPANAGFVDTTGPARKPGRVWDLPIEGVYTVPSPAYREGVLYFGSDVVTYAIDVTEGTVAWQTDLEYLAHHYPVALDGDRLLVSTRTMQGARAGGGEGALYALDRSGGSVEWRLDAPLSSGPTVVDDEVYVTSSDGTGVLHALDRDGESRWTVEFDHDGARTTSAFREPAVRGDALFVTTTSHLEDGTADGYCYALDRADGSVLWRRDVDAELRAGPVVGGDHVYAAAADGTLHAFAAESGDPVWRHDLGVEVLTTPVIDDQSAYVLAAGEVFAVDRSSGDCAWRTDIGATRMNGMAVATDGVYVGGSDVTALDADGTVRWKYPIPGAGGGYGAPIVIDEVVFVGACIKETSSSLYDDHMYALV